MCSTSKPKHTMADKSSMKAFQRFTQIEMKEHDHGECFFKVKDTSGMDICMELNMIWIWYEGIQTKWNGWMDYKNAVECKN
jgi:hypothetical protein